MNEKTGDCMKFCCAAAAGDDDDEDDDEFWCGVDEEVAVASVFLIRSSILSIL